MSSFRAKNCEVGHKPEDINGRNTRNNGRGKTLNNMLRACVIHAIERT